MATVILTPHSVAVGSINPTENGAVAAEKKMVPDPLCIVVGREGEE